MPRRAGDSVAPEAGHLEGLTPAETRRRWALVCLLCTAACAPPPPTSIQPDLQMWIHFDDVGVMQVAIARGDMDGARTAARRVEAVSEIEGIPPGSTIQLDRL